MIVDKLQAHLFDLWLFANEKNSMWLSHVTREIVTVTITLLVAKLRKVTMRKFVWHNVTVCMWFFACVISHVRISKTEKQPFLSEDEHLYTKRYCSTVYISELSTKFIRNVKEQSSIMTQTKTIDLNIIFIRLTLF